MNKSTVTEAEVNYYDILQCEQTASYAELKQNYQQLIRQYHPDKLANGPQEDYEKFLKIDKAWKTLRDDHLRKEYNNTQLQNEFKDNILIHAAISKSEICFDGGKDVVKYPCRCGSNYDIFKEYLVEKECIIECNECSNCIIIK